MTGVDPLSSLLSGIRAEGSVVSHAVLTAPWTIRFTDGAPLTMVSVLRGGGTLLLPDGTPRATARTPSTRSRASPRTPSAPPRTSAASAGAPIRTGRRR